METMLSHINTDHHNQLQISTVAAAEAQRSETVGRMSSQRVVRSTREGA